METEVKKTNRFKKFLLPVIITGLILLSDYLNGETVSTLQKQVKELKDEVAILTHKISPSGFSFERNISEKGVEKIYKLVNQYRVENRLKPLYVNPLLELSAKAKSLDMTERHYWGHDNPEGKSPWDFFEMVGYPNGNIGENLSVDIYEPEGIVDSWIKSPEHNKNLLRKEYTETGIWVKCHIDIEFHHDACLLVMHYGGR